MSDGIQRLHIFVRGRVQGVGFRYFVSELAKEMGLKGWVRNAGESVEIDVEGAAAQLTALRERLRTEKPRMSSVTAVEVVELPLQGFTQFLITSTI